MIAYGSVCSGIESASVAWEPLGMRPVWFSEIEAFPSAVLAHHWPHVSNLGDMTQIAAGIRTGLIEAPAVLVGGTPCQAFSVAGLRGGLTDPRGQLALNYVDILNAIDEQRGDGNEAVCVWENVPGVLSSKDNAFGCFLAALVGEDLPLEPAGKRWSNAGCVYGPQRAAAWRVLDAQYFGVAQRRRRVFVVASARNGSDPATVLFESESMRRDSAPSREAGQKSAGGFAPGVDLRNGALTGEVAHTIQAGQNAPDPGGTPHVFAVHGTQDPCTSEELAFALGRNNGGENAVCVTGDITQTLKGEGFDGSEDGTGRGQPIVAAFAENSRAELRLEGGDGQRTGAISGNGGKVGQSTPAIATGSAVRRLTPVECERLQGFPDNHTRIPWRNKPAEECPDGPRYKAIGNSKAVPVVRWVGERLTKLTEPS